VPRGRAPIDIDWSEHLTDPGFAQLLRFPAGVDDLDFTDGPTVVAFMVYMDSLATALAEAADYAAEQIARRNFARSVSAAMRDAGEDLGNSADNYRHAAWALRDNHPDLFELRVSKPVDPIGT
jgi:hypothetical protein